MTRVARSEGDLSPIDRKIIPYSGNSMDDFEVNGASNEISAEVSIELQDRRSFDFTGLYLTSVHCLQFFVSSY